ncbi:MAG: ankyrin repeat domain-containing protein [Longimicrobiales bacterium]
MSAGRDLPARPSLDSLRKQAKKLARDAAAGNSDAIARVHAQLPRAELPPSIRDAQLVIAREYGFAGWPDLTAEVQKRLGHALEWAATQAKVAIHDDQQEQLRALLAEYPALVSWRGEGDQTLLDATTSYAMDCSDPERERIYTRPVAAELLIDAGATVQRSTWEHVIKTGSSGMLHRLARKNALPRTLPVLAALGDDGAVRAWLDESRERDDAAGPDARIVIGRALMNACRFRHARIALQLLERSVALDPDLGRRIDSWQGGQAFVEFLIQHPDSLWHMGPEMTPWHVFVVLQLRSARDTDDLPAFRRWLSDEPWMLQEAFVNVQNGLIEGACYQNNREPFIRALLDCHPALLRIEPPPRSSALVFALDYGNAHLIPVLTRIWPLPDDLPFAAGTGNAAAVARWFDATGQPALGSLARHHPGSDPNFKAADLGWGPVTTQQVLDIALAWAVLNRHFEIASFLLERGADINTNWATHEPASILHEAAIQGNEDAVRFLIDHGADLQMEDYRYHSNAEGWARYGAHNERMADLLAEAAADRSRESA